MIHFGMWLDCRGDCSKSITTVKLAFEKNTKSVYLMNGKFIWESLECDVDKSISQQNNKYLIMTMGELYLK